MNIQTIISELCNFWSKEGCAILQPFDLPVGAGTFHPCTTLKAIGPESWNAVYVQPSRRPTDGRYGRHPNRLHKYYQLQVVQKPSPLDFQEKYLQSLQLLGIKTNEHDIRFIEDDWESPTLGAWGLGWEVWIDGMEVTQFTYFQEVGGVQCKPIMGEITYGVERLAMFLQNCDNVYELSWNETLNYGELHQKEELEHSNYNYSILDTQELLIAFEHASSLCTKLLEQESPLLSPAYEQVIYSSHIFNLLDAHGYFSVEARASMIAKIRNLTTSVIQAKLNN